MLILYSFFSNEFHCHNTYCVDFSVNPSERYRCGNVDRDSPRCTEVLSVWFSLNYGLLQSNLAAACRGQTP